MKLRRWHCFAFLAVFVRFLALENFSLNAAPGLDPQYSFRVWQSDDGLPQSSVQAITQTRDGYLWVGTQKGLARFDGVHFVVFNPRNTPELKHFSVTALLETRDGTLWIGTEGGGVTFLRNGKFSSLTHQDGLPSNVIRTFFESSAGSIWIGTAYGLVAFRNGKIEPTTMRNAVRSISEGSDGTLWLSTDRGVRTLREGNFATPYMEFELGVRRSILLDAKTNLWIGAMDGLAVINNGRTSGRWNKNSGLSSDIVNVVFKDHDENLWIGTFGGLNRLSRDGVMTEIKRDGESYDLVFSIFQDREGNLWIGAKDGLTRLNPQRFVSYTRQQGLSHNNVMSILEDRFGAMWIGTWSGGLNYLKEGKIGQVASDRPSNHLILGLCEGHNGGLWAGMDYNAGVYQLENGRLVPQFTDITDSAVRVILHERDVDRFWVGTSQALDVIEYGQKVRRYTTTNGIAGNVIRVIFQDEEGAIWIGTNDGLSQWKDGKFTNFTTRNGLSHNTVIALHGDKEGNLWIGTVGGGLNRMRRQEAGDRRQEAGGSSQESRFTSYTTKDGLFSDDVFEILEDDDGNLWMSSRGGVFRATKKNFDEFDEGKTGAIACIVYGRADGMVSSDCNSSAKPSAYKSRDGRLWFATSKGVCVVDPKSLLKPNELAPPVFIEEVVADKKPVTDFPRPAGGEVAGALHKNVNSSSTVRLPPGRGELEFHYTALSFRAPEKNRFRYKLEGVDSDWIEAGTRRIAHYNNILPGDYRFRVMGCNNDGVWNEAGTSLALVLSPHFWQTWWFKFSLALAAVLIVAGIYGVREAQRKQIERLRLRLAADLHDEVGSNLGSISLLSRMMVGAENLADDQRNDLALINRVSKETANSIKDIVWFTNPQFDTLHDLVKRMEDVAKTLLSGLECQFEGHVEDTEQKLSLEFRQNVFLIFKESLANVLKHSHATRVEIEVSQRGDEWRMRVSDNGAGFDLKTVEQGNGLVNLRRRATRMRGELEIETQRGQGTSIRFVAPLGRQSASFFAKRTS